MEKGIFREESVKKVSSPEELHDYIRIANPAIWVILGAVVLLLAVLGVWVGTARIDNTVEVRALVQEGKLLCYCAEPGALSVGQEVRIGGAEGQISSVSQRPVSREQVEADVNGDAYTLYCLDVGEWSFVVEIAADTSALQTGDVITVSVITDSVSPLSFVLG